MTYTVLIPLFNTPANHLIEAVESVVAQTKAPILLIDDGSTLFETTLAMQILKSRYNNQVQTHVLEKNLGTPSALNIGHSMINTEYVMLNGSSDIFLTGKISHQLDYLKKHPETDVLGTGLVAFKDSDPWRRKSFDFVHAEKPTPGSRSGHNKFFIVNHGTTIYRKSVVDAVGGYNEKYRRAQDVELWERLWNAKAVFRNIEKVLYLWRR